MDKIENANTYIDENRIPRERSCRYSMLRRLAAG